MTSGEAAHSVWATALAVGVLLHEAQFGAQPFGSHGVVVAAALWLLVRPSSVLRTIGVLGAVAIELLVDLPHTWNHTMFLGIVGAAATVDWLVRGRRGRRPTADEVRLRAGPLLRSSFVLIWLAAAFAKLNSGFAEKPESCGLWLVEQVPGVTVPGELVPAVLHGAMVVEFAVPVLLLVRRLRPLGIALGWGFHLVVALAGHTAFSGIAWAMYLLFLDADVLVDCRRLARRRWHLVLDRLRLHRAWAAAGRRPVGTFALALIGAFAYLLLLQEVPAVVGDRARRWIPAAAYVVWAGAWAAMLIAVARRRGRVGLTSAVRFRPSGPVLTAGLLLLVVNAASPYIGAKTLSSFTMYSDLRTEPGAWNHWVLPESVRVLDWQDDMVQVLAVDDARLAARLGADDGPVTVPALGIRVHADQFGHASIAYAHDGQRRQAERLQDDPLLGRRVSALQDAVGAMRTFGAPQRCQV